MGPRAGARAIARWSTRTGCGKRCAHSCSIGAVSNLLTATIIRIDERPRETVAHAAGGFASAEPPGHHAPVQLHARRALHLAAVLYTLGRSAT